MAIEFELPGFLSSGTDVDSVHKRMLAQGPFDIDATESGFLWDFTRPSAVIISELLEFWIPETLKLLFTDTSSGKYLDYLAELAQTSRKSATYASVELAFTGEPLAAIPAGTVVSTAAINGKAAVEFSTLEECVLDSSGEGTVKAQAVNPGAGSNVDANTLVLLAAPVSGVTSVTNPEAAAGGTETETDAQLKARVNRINKESGGLSHVGNPADYKRWAEEVPGVGAATVIPEWDGPQTVKIIITDANGNAPNEDIKTAVYNHLMSPDILLERLTPPDMSLTVAAPEMRLISYSAIVELKEGYTMESVTAAYRAALLEYYREAAEEREVKYSMAGAILSGIAGVNDFKSLAVNNVTTNTALDEGEYPCTYEITFTEGVV